MGRKKSNSRSRDPKHHRHHPSSHFSKGSVPKKRQSRGTGKRFEKPIKSQARSLSKKSREALLVIDLSTEDEDEEQEGDSEDISSDASSEDNEMHQHYLRHYELHCQDDPSLEAEEDRCHWCQIRKFSSHDRYPIYIINKVDNETLPANFRFIENSVILPGVERPDEGFRIGCECEESGDCKRVGCDCLSDMAIAADSENSQKIYVYHSHGPKKGCLRSSFLNSRDPIYECHSGCACDQDCPNRIVDRGRQVPLQIFRTIDRGWGVRSTIDIKVGQFVDKYVGELMTAYQANFRRKKSHIAQRKDVYLFALDKFSDPDSADLRLAGDALEVDGEFKSGPTRFINHSCEPNLRIFARVGAHADRHIHDLAFFAIEDISAGTELTFDYVDGNEDVTNDSRDWKKRKDMTKCLCGSKSCRGYLW